MRAHVAAAQPIRRTPIAVCERLDEGLREYTSQCEHVPRVVAVQVQEGPYLKGRSLHSGAAVKCDRRAVPTGLSLGGSESEGRFRCQSLRVELGEKRGLSGSRGGSASQLQIQRRLHKPCDSRSEPCKIADVPGQQSICSRFQSAMSNERIIGCCADDGPRGS